MFITPPQPHIETIMENVGFPFLLSEHNHNSDIFRAGRSSWLACASPTRTFPRQNLTLNTSRQISMVSVQNRKYIYAAHMVRT